MEEWKEIQETSNKYSISNYGRMKNNKTKNVLKTSINRRGYVDITICYDRIRKKFRIHRLVAKYFIPNPDNKPQVNHIDGNKLNNRADNLEWCTNYENAHHAIKHGLWDNVFKASRISNEKRKKKVLAHNKITGKTILFESISEAERTFKTRHINAVIKGRRKSAKGYWFEYAENGGDENAT